MKGLFPVFREQLANFRLNAAWVGYSWDVESTDTNRAGVAIRNLASGRKRTAPALVGNQWATQLVNRLAVNPKGDIAWVGDGWLSGPPVTSPQGRQILVLDGSDQRAQLLDEGLDILPRSVTIGRSAVHWTDSEGPHQFPFS
ncbi:MAG TPA: hypothetical protein VNM38_01450 [Solirubrobacterales bacterium]|nr:hypothetical protein [Solirubrobacterales bacterium]